MCSDLPCPAADWWVTRKGPSLKVSAPPPSSHKPKGHFHTERPRLGLEKFLLLLCTETTVHPQPSLVASSLALAFSSLAMRATDLGPSTLPPQWRRICKDQRPC